MAVQIFSTPFYERDLISSTLPNFTNWVFIHSALWSFLSGIFFLVLHKKNWYSFLGKTRIYLTELKENNYQSTILVLNRRYHIIGLFQVVFWHSSIMNIYYKISSKLYHQKILHFMQVWTMFFFSENLTKMTCKCIKAEWNFWKDCWRLEIW